jgi:phage tail sheath protein FI
MANERVGVNIRVGGAVSPVEGVATAVSGLIGTFYKGPLNTATLVTSMAQFERIFGDQPAPGTTSYYSAKGFFQAVPTGNLYVVRVASSAAAKAFANFKDKGNTVDTVKVEAKTEGAWGLDLLVDVDDDSILSTTPAANINAGATNATLNSVDGLEIGSDLKLYNGADTEYRRLIQIDAANKIVYWTSGLTNSYTTANGVITSVEFKLSVYLKGVLVETHPNLSMNDSVTFFCEKIVNAASDYIVVTDLKSADTDYQDQAIATSAAVALASGADGLSDIDKADWEGTQAGKTGIYAFDEIEDVFRIACPNPTLTDADPAAAYIQLVQTILDYASGRVTVEYYADVPYNKSVADAVTFADNFAGRNITFFWPWGAAQESGLAVWTPPAAVAMGVAVEKDYRRGVHKNAGNESMPYFTDLEYFVSRAEGETLNDAGINTIRQRPGRGMLTYGGRTKSATTQFRFLHYAEYWAWLARSLEAAGEQFIFEPHAPDTWKSVERIFNNFLSDELRKGALHSVNGAAAYLVKMDSDVNPAAQVAQGLGVVQVEYVPVGTLEKFVIELTGSPTGLTLVTT